MRLDPDGGQADVAHLQHAPGFQHLGEGDRVLGEHEVEMRHELLWLEGRDVGARSLADLHHLHDGEGTERLPEHRPADLHLGRQVPLGRELVARPEPLCLDQLQEAVGDLLRQRAPVQHGEHRPSPGAVPGRPATGPRLVHAHPSDLLDDAPYPWRDAMAI